MKHNAHVTVPHLIAAKRLTASLAVVLFVAAACSESRLPTETKLGVQPHLANALLGGCPNPFMLGGMLDTDGQAADRNADGLACYLVENDVIVSWTDNNVPLSQIGGCPNAFTLTYGKFMDPKYADVDRNGDGFACFRITGTGNTIVIDNNDHTSGMM